MAIAALLPASRERPGTAAFIAQADIFRPAAGFPLELRQAGYIGTRAHLAGFVFKLIARSGDIPGHNPVSTRTAKVV
jgi:hypothetical protein